MTARCMLCKKYAPHWDPARMCLRPCRIQLYWRRGVPTSMCHAFVNDDGAQFLWWHANYTLPEGEQYDA